MVAEWLSRLGVCVRSVSGLRVSNRLLFSLRASNSERNA